MTTKTAWLASCGAPRATTNSLLASSLERVRRDVSKGVMVVLPTIVAIPGWPNFVVNRERSG